jgi:hypothetical protein
MRLSSDTGNSGVEEERPGESCLSLLAPSPPEKPMGINLETAETTHHILNKYPHSSVLVCEFGQIKHM